MKIILFGASGMVGQGVLRECLIDPEIETVLLINRSPTDQTHGKIHEIVTPDVGDLTAFESQLTGYDACFFCLGVSSFRMTGENYRRVTFDLTLGAAGTLAKLNPQLTFLYVSGAGTDSTEKGGSMWARVKGATENALLRLPLKAAYMIRPGAIQALHGIKSKTKIYNLIYPLLAPLFPIAKRLFPNHILTTEQLGRAMIEIAKHGAPKPLLETWDLQELASRSNAKI
jgi:uncharacterized protein YbjT (DUF2867 family)